jgi:hypothetical protein
MIQNLDATRGGAASAFLLPRARAAGKIAANNGER